MQQARSETVYRGGDSASANPYRLDVFTASVRDVVAEAGGWIVDRVLAGWIVTVITGPRDDAERAGRILGCEVTVRSATADCVRPRPYGIALTSALYGTDDQLQQGIADVFDHAAEISLIGVRPYGQGDPRLRPVTHRLSSAAQAFKAHSLAAAKLPHSPVADTERFLSAVRQRPDVAATDKRRRTNRRRGTARDLFCNEGDAVSLS